MKKSDRKKIIDFFVTVCIDLREECKQGVKHRKLGDDVNTLKQLLKEVSSEN